MEKCPRCGRTYHDNTQQFCVDDGTLLVRVPTTEDSTVSFYDLPQTSVRPSQFPSMPTVQAKKKSNLLIFGGVAAALLVLLVGAGIIIFLAVKMSSSKGNDPANINLSNTNQYGSNSNQKTLVGNNSDKYKPELIMAIKAADDAQANAYSTYDTTSLKNYYTGEALKASLAQVDSLKKTKSYTSNALENQEFEYFKVNDAGTEAEVRVVETWTTMLLQTPSAKCLTLYQSQKQPQTIYLKNTSTGWMVNVIVYDAGNKQVASPCPKTDK